MSRILPSAQTDRHPLQRIADGFRYVRGNRLVLATITLDLFVVLLAGATALLPIFARDILHVGASGLEGANLVGETAKIGGQDGRGDDGWLATHASISSKDVIPNEVSDLDSTQATRSLAALGMTPQPFARSNLNCSYAALISAAPGTTPRAGASHATTPATTSG